MKNFVINDTRLPITEKIVKEIISLPIYPEFKINDQMRVINLLKKFLKNYEKNKKFKKIIITGGLGHIGSYLVENLLKKYKNIHLIIIDSLLKKILFIIQFKQ